MTILRVSDADREEVVARLGSAAAEGRLTLEEFGDRSATAYAATYQSELDVLLADLPRPSAALSSLALPVAAIAGGTVWMPLFPYLDYGAVPAAAGIVFGILSLRGRSPAYRVAGTIGLLGGFIGVVAQAASMLAALYN